MLACLRKSLVIILSQQRDFVVRFLSNLNFLFGGVSTRLVADRAAIV
jgi:hypothetical protein